MEGKEGWKGEDRKGRRVGREKVGREGGVEG